VTRHDFERTTTLCFFVGSHPPFLFFLARARFRFHGGFLFLAIFGAWIWGEGGAFKPPSDLKLSRLPAVQPLVKIGKRARSIGKNFDWRILIRRAIFATDKNLP
jgi:hypothetical protein